MAGFGLRECHPLLIDRPDRKRALASLQRNAYPFSANHKNKFETMCGNIEARAYKSLPSREFVTWPHVAYERCQSIWTRHRVSRSRVPVFWRAGTTDRVK